MGKFHSTLTDLILLHIPHKVCKSHFSASWITASLRKQKRDNLYRRMKLTGSHDLYQQFKSLKYSIQKDLRNAYREYINIH